MLATTTVMTISSSTESSAFPSLSMPSVTSRRKFVAVAAVGVCRCLVIEVCVLPRS